MKFRKKPVVIEATQFIPGLQEDIAGIEWDIATMPFIRTLEGAMRVSPMDWIITGVNGEKYLCKQDAFHKTYEAVTE